MIAVRLENSHEPNRTSEGGRRNTEGSDNALRLVQPGLEQPLK